MSVLTVNLQDSNAKELFPLSLRDTGFAVVTNHPISADLINAVYDEWAKFFNGQEKFDYTFDKDTQAGYFPFKSENAKGYPVKDLKEFYHFYDAHGLPKGFSDNTKTLKTQLFSLAATLLQWIEDATPEEIRCNFSMPLHTMVDGCEKNLLRILNYPPLVDNDEEGAIRAAPHEDIDLLTLLVAANEPGLQVKNSIGEWYDVSCEPGSIVVNAGDMLELATNRYYKSTTHQVVNPIGASAKKARLSIPYFLHPHNHVRLSPNFTAGEFLNLRLHALGLLSDEDLGPELLKFVA